MVHIDPKFTQLVNQQRLEQGVDPYDIDLRKEISGGPGSNQVFFSFLGCERDTLGSQCGCQSQVLTVCGNCNP